MAEIEEAGRMKVEMAKALVAAQRAAKAVLKDSENTFHRYRYASAEDMVEEGRGALNSAGLALTTLSWDVYENGTRIGVYYELVHESGATREYKCTSAVIPEKGRPQDKAEATALTYNLGYFMRGLLCLPRSDERDKDHDVDRRDDRSKEPARREPEKRQAPPVTTAQRPAGVPEGFTQRPADQDAIGAKREADTQRTPPAEGGAVAGSIPAKEDSREWPKMPESAGTLKGMSIDKLIPKQLIEAWELYSGRLSDAPADHPKYGALFNFVQGARDLLELRTGKAYPQPVDKRKAKGGQDDFPEGLR